MFIPTSYYCITLLLHISFNIFPSFFFHLFDLGVGDETAFALLRPNNISSKNTNFYYLF